LKKRTCSEAGLATTCAAIRACNSRDFGNLLRWGTNFLPRFLQLCVWKGQLVLKQLSCPQRCSTAPSNQEQLKLHWRPSPLVGRRRHTDSLSNQSHTFADTLVTHTITMGSRPGRTLARLMCFKPSCLIKAGAACIDRGAFTVNDRMCQVVRQYIMRCRQ
jgi:hypothetical protein